MTDDLRKILKDWRNQCRDILRGHDREIDKKQLPELPPFPIECIGLNCGARTRSGKPCKIKQIYLNGRCKFHGGLSTGPKTLEGKQRSALKTGKSYDELLMQRNRWQ